MYDANIYLHLFLPSKLLLLLAIHGRSLTHMNHPSSFRQNQPDELDVLILSERGRL